MDVLILSRASEFVWANQGVIKYILKCSYSAEIFPYLTLARKYLWPALKAEDPWSPWTAEEVLRYSINTAPSPPAITLPSLLSQISYVWKKATIARSNFQTPRSCFSVLLGWPKCIWEVLWISEINPTDWRSGRPMMASEKQRMMEVKGLDHRMRKLKPHVWVMIFCLALLRRGFLYF